MNRISEPLVGSKMAISLEVKLCLSDFSRGIERQKEGYQETNITLILRRPVDLFLIDNIFDTLFLTDSCQLSKRFLITQLVEPKVIFSSPDLSFGNTFK